MSIFWSSDVKSFDAKFSKIKSSDVEASDMKRFGIRFSWDWYSWMFLNTLEHSWTFRHLSERNKNPWTGNNKHSVIFKGKTSNTVSWKQMKHKKLIAFFLFNKRKLYPVSSAFTHYNPEKRICKDLKVKTQRNVTWNVSREIDCA